MTEFQEEIENILNETAVREIERLEEERKRDIEYQKALAPQIAHKMIVAFKSAARKDASTIDLAMHHAKTGKFRAGRSYDIKSFIKDEIYYETSHYLEECLKEKAAEIGINVKRSPQSSSEFTLSITF